ncbi:MAG: alkaline phosphatase family protein, partial [Acidimicrobiales bacterium]
MGASQSSRVEHVVVLMLENRSFDHVLGFLEHPDQRFDGLRGGEHHNVRSDGTPVPATDDGEPRRVDPDHSHEGALEQIGPFKDVPANGGFVRNYETRIPTLGDEPWAKEADAGDVMRCLHPDKSPVLTRLALEFAVCHAWFCSVPGETWPNRNFAHAATSDGTVNIEAGFFYDRTIFEHLTKAGATWHVYYDGTPQIWCYRKLWRARTIIDFVMRRPARIGRWYEMPSFFEHVAAGTLPNYSFVEPSHNRYFRDNHKGRTNSQHPGNNKEDDADYRGGEQLIQDVYQALLDRPQLFATTLLLIVFDEHGGLYDHAPPPVGVPPGDPIFRGLIRRIGRHVRAYFDRKNNQRRNKSFDFKRLGVRVPAVLVSPWIEPGTLVTACFDHASIPATLRALFCPDLKPLTDRDRDAATFHQVVVTPRSEPRPNPRGGGVDGAPLPDFDPAATAETVAAEVRAHRTARAGPPTARRAVTAEAPAEAPPTDLEVELRKLEEDVNRRLNRRPAVLWARA